LEANTSIRKLLSFSVCLKKDNSERERERERERGKCKRQIEGVGEGVEERILLGH